MNHRTVDEILKKSLLYFRDLSSTQPFLFMMHLQDLGYPNTPRNAEPLSYEERSMFGAMDNFSDELGRFFSELKRIQRWNDSLIVVAGLRGRSDTDRTVKISALNLHSENTQVALFMKPPNNRPRDEKQNWKVDQNVTLADLGPTIREYLDLKMAPGPAKTMSLKSLLQNTQTNEGQNHRTIFLESGYSSWRLNQKPFAAFVNSDYLYIHNFKKELYNLRLDSFELNPTKINSAQNEQFHEGWINQAIHQSSAVPFDEETIELLFPQNLFEDTLLWNHTNNDREVISRLLKYDRIADSKNHPRYHQWLLHLLLNQRKWSELVAQSTNEYLTFVALLNLDIANTEDKKKNTKLIKAQIENLVKKNDCLQVIHDLYLKKVTLENASLNSCPDEKLKISLQYLFSANSEALSNSQPTAQSSSRDSVRKRLEVRLKSHLIFRRFVLLNESRQLEFDLDIDHSRLNEPFETVLYLPTMNRLRIELLNNLITRDSRTQD
ncbi:MAG: hypothetical protein ACK5WZ_13035, partial [Pseudobdellovibrionaceae bacterium]